MDLFKLLEELQVPHFEGFRNAVIPKNHEKLVKHLDLHGFERRIERVVRQVFMLRFELSGKELKVSNVVLVFDVLLQLLNVQLCLVFDREIVIEHFVADRVLKYVNRLLQPAHSAE